MIGNIVSDNFKIKCISCGESKNLEAVAIREGSGIRGWVFVCQTEKCRGKVWGKNFELTENESKERKNL